jgi:uncharacterized SAM-binding protein YcdF (DUF218 family)
MKVSLLKIIFGLILFIITLTGSMQAYFSRNIMSALVKSDAIVLLSGNYKERAPAAAMLMRNGYADKIILTNDGVFSSWSIKYNRNLYQVEWAEEELVKLGVPRERIVTLPFYGSGTIYDALAVKRYLLASGLKKIILVTSDYHMRRALWTFRHVLDGVTKEIAVFPARSAGIGFKAITVEYVKFAGYFLRYGLFKREPELAAGVVVSGRP